MIGYARVSAEDQNLDLQRQALRAAGCERIFEDTAGGAAERPALREALAQLRAGDTLVVWCLDRLGRSLKDLIAHAESLRTQGVGLRSLKEAIDTDSSAGQLVFHIFGALAEFERALIRERTRAVLDEDQRRHAVELYRSGQRPVKEICALVGISRSMLYAYVEEFAEAGGAAAPGPRSPVMPRVRAVERTCGAS